MADTLSAQAASAATAAVVVRRIAPVAFSAGKVAPIQAEPQRSSVVPVRIRDTVEIRTTTLRPKVSHVGRSPLEVLDLCGKGRDVGRFYPGVVSNCKTKSSSRRSRR